MKAGEQRRERRKRDIDCEGDIVYYSGVLKRGRETVVESRGEFSDVIGVDLVPRRDRVNGSKGRRRQNEGQKGARNPDSGDKVSAPRQSLFQGNEDPKPERVEVKVDRVSPEST